MNPAYQNSPTVKPVVRIQRQRLLITVPLFLTTLLSTCLDLPTDHSTSPPPTSTYATAIPTATEIGPGVIHTALPTPSPTPLIAETRILPPADTPQPDLQPTDSPAGCALGIGLRQETTTTVMNYSEHPGLIMSANTGLSVTYFPKLEGWTRILGAPSLADLEQKAQRAADQNIPYEALGYGLETSRSTPDEEWQNLVDSTAQARAVSDRYNKTLAMGPGFRLMSQNEEAYDPMAALAGIWLLQTQQLQKEPPGPEYRQKVNRLVEQIRSANPGIIIWAQITLPPDREPSAEEWLSYRELIQDLVDGTYIGVYTWDTLDSETLIAEINIIFSSVCGSE